jgi:hypothetical protein
MRIGVCEFQNTWPSHRNPTRRYNQIMSKLSASQLKTLKLRTKKLIESYGIVQEDLAQDIGYSRKGERVRKKALALLESRLWELENVWLEVQDNLDD